MNSFAVWFKGLRGKLLFLVSIPVVVVSVVSGLSYMQIGDLERSVQKANTVRLPMQRYNGEMTSAINAVARWAWAAQAAEGNATERAQALGRVRAEIENFKKYHDTFAELNLPEDFKERFRTVDDNMKAFNDSVQEAIVLLSKATPKDDEHAKNLVKTSVRQAIETIARALDDIDIRLEESSKQETQEDVSHAEMTKYLLMVTGFLSTIGLFIFGIFIASRLAQTLAQVTKRISDSGVQVNSASEQLSSASQQLSSGATEAASSLEETVSSLEQLSSMVKLNADNAKEASSLSQSSRQSAEDGENEIKSLIEAMTDISRSSKKIEEIINVIDDIAFQTNLLALNAAVEAARAGEQGKGFAVVAEAVRNLAQRSASAAKDITVLIKDSVDQISNGSRIADQSGEVLKNIVTSVKKVSDLNNEIASASAEQSNGITQISKAMNELDQATQRNAASAEETAASSKEMSSQSIELQGLVGQLGAIIDGGRVSSTYTSSVSDAPKGTSFLKAPWSTASLKPGKVKSTLGLVKAKVAPAAAKPKPAAEIKAKPTPAADATALIPFDDDQPAGNGKIGNTVGF